VLDCLVQSIFTRGGCSTWDLAWFVCLGDSLQHHLKLAVTTNTLCGGKRQRTMIAAGACLCLVIFRTYSRTAPRVLAFGPCSQTAG